MAASIRFNGFPGPLQIVAGPVALSNFNNTGVLGWHWELLDRPTGSAAAISSPFAAAPSFTADTPGSYRVRLRTYVDAGRTVLDASDIQITYILFPSPFEWRKPAAGETKEVDPNRGWATARDEFTDDAQAYMQGGLQTAFAEGPTIELGGGVFAITQGGALVFRFNGATGRAEMEDGLDTAPSLAFRLDLDTGFYRPAGDTLGITSGGQFVAKFRRPLVAAAGTLATLDLVSDVGAISGTAGFDAIRMDVQGAPTGSGVRRLLHFTRDGAERLQVMDAGHLRAIDGSNALPAFSFVNDDDTGSYLVSAGVYGIATAGVERVRFTLTDSQLTGNWLPEADNTRNLGSPIRRWANLHATSITTSSSTFDDGTVAAPSITFTLDTNTGFFRLGSGVIGVTGDGLEIVRLQAPSGLSPQAQFALGTAAKPSISFNDGFSTAGFFMPSAGVLGFVSGGNERWRVQSGAFSARAADSQIVQGSANTTLPIRSQLTTGAGPGLLFDNDAIGATAFTATAGEQIHIGQAFTVNQSLTAGWVAHRIAVTQTAEGSGDRSFLDFYNGVAGATRAFRVTSEGRVGISSGVTFASGATSNPGLYFLANVDTGIAMSPAFGGAPTDTIVVVQDGGFCAGFARMTNVGRVLCDTGASDRPSLTSHSSTSTGLWWGAGQLNVSTAGTFAWQFTGTDLNAQVSGSQFGIAVANSHLIIRANTTTSTTAALNFLNDSSFAAAAGAQRGARFAHAIGQSGTAGFSTIELARVESALGSGEQNFINAYGGAAGTTQIFRITNAGAVLGGAGAVGAPTFSFLGDPDTGFYSIGAADVIGVSLGGILRWHFAGDEIRAQRAAGGFRQSTADSGLSYTGQIGASATASHSFLNSGQFNAAAGVQIGMQIAFGISQSGTAGLTVLELQGNVVGGTGSGVYNLIDAKFGSSQFRVTSTGRTYVGDGDASLPGIAFQNDSGTGAYRAGASTMTFVGGTSAIATIAGGPKQFHLDQGGSGVTPSIAWSADPNTGLFSAAADFIGFTTGGVETSRWTQKLSSVAAVVETVWQFTGDISQGGQAGYRGLYVSIDENTTGSGTKRPFQIDGGGGTTVLFFVDNAGLVQATSVFRGPDGAVGTPTYSFINETNTGVARIAASTLGMVVTGTERARFTADAAGGTLSFMGFGSTLNPNISWNGDQSTGIFNPIDNSIGFTANNVEVARFVGPGANLQYLALFSGNITSSTATGANRLYTKNIVKMWAKVTTGAAPVVDDGFNITSITSAAGTDMIITIATDMGDANYAVVLTGMDGLNDLFAAHTEAVGTFRIAGFDADAGTQYDLDTVTKEIGIIVIGIQ